MVTISEKLTAADFSIKFKVVLQIAHLIQVLQCHVYLMLAIENLLYNFKLKVKLRQN